MSEHWAFDLIGRPYDLGAGGPDSFDCWGLVRWVFKNVHGIELPMVAVGESGNERAIRSAIDVSGWSPVAGDAEENDIATMDGPDGKHVGIVLIVNGSAVLLHSLERIGVCVQPVTDLGRAGFHSIVLWRRTSA